MRSAGRLCSVRVETNRPHAVEWLDLVYPFAVPIVISIGGDGGARIVRYADNTSYANEGSDDDDDR